MKGISSKAVVIDDAIEQFEREWSAARPDLIEEVVSTVGLGSDSELVVELIRVDIDRRYGAGVEVELSSYLARFPFLREIPQSVGAICFEDYRARKSRRQSCPIGRWSMFPGVDSQGWFQELLADTQFSRESHLAGAFPSTASFLSSEAGFREADAAGPAGEVRGDRVGDFELVSLLGEGAFSRVYLARQVSLGRRYVAVKVVDRPMQEQFHLARLQHTGIVPLYSCHEVQGRWVLCMPYSGATTMARWLREVRVPGERTGASLNFSVRAAQEKLACGSREGISGSGTVGEDVAQSLKRWHQAASRPLEQLSGWDAGRLALWMFCRMASALSHAHQRGLVHGDLKPANVLIRNDGEPALIDFNLSQNTEKRPKVWVGGTLPYMSTEQLRQLKSQTTGPARPEYDIHALGVIMFEMLEGRLPFVTAASSSAEDLEAALRSHETGPVFRNSVASEGLRAILQACLSSRVASVYPTAAELLVDLEREAANQSLKYATEPWFRSRLPKMMRRYPRAISAGLISGVSIAIIVSLAIGLWNARERTWRLQALESLQNLRTMSDRAFGAFTFSKIFVEDQAERRPEMILANCFPTLKSEGAAKFEQTWTGLVGRLSDEERSEAEDRLLGLGLIASLEMLSERDEEAESASDLTVADARMKRELQAVYAVLPGRVRESVAGQVLRQILGEGGSEQGGAGAAAVPRNALDRLETAATDAYGKLFYAVGLMERHQPEKALDVLSRTSVVESLGPFYWMLRGRCQYELSQYREAVASFSAVLSQAENVEAARMIRGYALMRQGKFAEAEADFSEMVRRNPELVGGYVQRAEARQKQGRNEESLEDLNKAVGLQPKSSRIRLTRMQLLKKMQRLQQAEQDLEYVMQNEPVTAEDWNARALARLPGAPDEALKDLQEAERLFGPVPVVLQNMAHVLSEHLERESESIAVLDRLIEKSPRYQKALSGRAVLHGRAGDVERTQQDVDTLLALPELRTAQINFQIACALALISKDQPRTQQEAMVWLARAVAGGYGGDLLDTDPDLQAVRHLMDFQMIRRTAGILAGRNREK